jgi:hypothetical protein
MRKLGFLLRTDKLSSQLLSRKSHAQVFFILHNKTFYQFRNLYLLYFFFNKEQIFLTIFPNLPEFTSFSMTVEYTINVSHYLHFASNYFHISHELSGMDKQTFSTRIYQWTFHTCFIFNYFPGPSEFFLNTSSHFHFLIILPSDFI